MLPVGELAAESGYSQRHLNRLFGETVGMNVKTFARLVRVNGAIRAAAAGLRFSRRAGAGGRLLRPVPFYPRFFAYLRGRPGAYLQNLSAFYNEIFKF